MLKEIEILFHRGGPRPWLTEPGDRLLDAKMHELEQKGEKRVGVDEERLEYEEKNSSVV